MIQDQNVLCRWTEVALHIYKNGIKVKQTMTSSKEETNNKQ